MNRLQKKCLIATAGFHLLLVLVILFGAAFFTSHEKPDETTLLTVIPANLIDAAFNSGVKAVQPPAPTPPHQFNNRRSRRSQNLNQSSRRIPNQ